MAHYLVYVPAEHFEAAEKSGRHPLDYVGLADHVPNAMGVRITDGPDHKGGQLYGWMVPTAQHRLNYNAEQQDWLPAVPDPNTEAAAQRYWLGFWKESPVVPRDLMKNQQVPGIGLELGSDGHEWRVPTAKTLPTEAELTPTGEWATKVQSQYAEYCTEILTWRNTLDAGERWFSLTDLYELTLRVLAVNYRLTREVIARLRILRNEDVWAVLFAATGRTLQEPDADG